MEELTCRPFGRTAQGCNVELWELRAGEYAAQILTYGGILRSFTVPAPGGSRDIVLGCETLADYQAQDKYFGALVGRVANRIGGACFDLAGRHYSLAANSGPNCLHGGIHGFHQAVWNAQPTQAGGLALTYLSQDGEEGFPGRLQVEATYCLNQDGTLRLDFRARSDQDTLCSLTNHSYFNLLGHGANTLAGQRIQILSDAITEADGSGAPTGRMLPVEGTPFDLRHPRGILEGLALSHPQLELAGGYDHNYALCRQPRRPLTLAARAEGGGLALECWTTQPGLQFYTANYLDGVRGKQGIAYGPRSAFCLESQSWPDAIHHPGFPTMVLRAGEWYDHTTQYRLCR